MKRGHYILIIIICIIILSWAFGGLYILFTDVQAVKTYELSDKANPPKSGTIEEFCIKYPEYCDATIEDKIRRIAKQENYNNPELLIRISSCETVKWQYFTGHKDKRDIGWYQINQHYNPTGYECAMDLECSTKWTINEIRQKRLWKWNASKFCWIN